MNANSPQPAVAAVVAAGAVGTSEEARGPRVLSRGGRIGGAMRTKAHACVNWTRASAWNVRTCHVHPAAFAARALESESGNSPEGSEVYG